MNDDSAGVYDWEGGKSGITRKAPPEWYTPQIDRKVLRALMQRSNYRAFINIGLWLLLMAVLAYFAAITISSPWCILLFFAYGQVFGNASARWHECLHGTPFRTPILNEIVYFLACAADFRDTVFTRWSHVTHHSYTIHTDVDLEIHIPRPSKLRKILPDLLYINAGMFLIPQLVLHSLGIPTRTAKRVVPPEEYVSMFWAARGALALHAAAIVLAIVLHSWLPILLFTLPRFYGAALLFVYGMTQHAGLAQDVNDHRLVARTVLIGPINSFLYMGMQYHVEHHIFPSVPFYALKKLHEAVRDQMPQPYKGLWAAWKEMIPVILRQRHDADYYVRRELPRSSPALR